MKPVKEVRQIFDEHGGMLRTRELYTNKIFYNDIQQLVKDGLVEKIRYGYYQ